MRKRIHSLQRDVGILGRIFGGAIELDQIERDLLLAGPADVLERDAIVIEMLFGEIVERMAVEAAGIEVEAHHQRVVIGRDADAAAIQDDPVELEVVPDLQDRLVFQQRLELAEHELGGELVGPLGEHVVAAMFERNVAGLVAVGGEADPDQFGADAVAPVRLGVERDPTLGVGIGDPAVERGFLGHRLVERAVDLRLGTNLGLGRLAGDLLRFGAQGKPRQQRLEAVFFEEFAQGRLGNALDLQRVERILQGRIADQFDQPARQPRLVGMLDQIVSHLRRLHLGGCGEHRLDVAKFLDQLRRGLGADAGNAGDIVDAVAHQGEHLADLLGRNAEFLDHLLAADAAVVHRIEHVEPGLDQLHQILVGRDDGDLPPLGQGRLGIAGDDVVSLQPHFLEAGDGEGAGGVADQRELRHQFGRRRRPVRLILVVHLVAERAFRRVQDDGEMGRPVRLVEAVGELPEHGRIAIDRADIQAVLVGQRRQPMESAEDVGRTVDEIEMWGRHGGGSKPR